MDNYILIHTRFLRIENIHSYLKKNTIKIGNKGIEILINKNYLEVKYFWYRMLNYKTILGLDGEKKWQN